MQSKVLKTLEGNELEIEIPEYEIIPKENNYAKNGNWGNKRQTFQTLDSSKKKGGQPPKLTSVKATIIIEGIKNGLTLQRTCGLAGIDYQTLLNWIRKGEKQESGKYRWFYEQCVKADSECEHLPLKTIKDAIIGNHFSEKINKVYNKNGILIKREVTKTTVPPSWTAAMTLLERRYPKRWSKSDRLQLSEDPENPMISKQTLLNFFVNYVDKNDLSPKQIDMNKNDNIYSKE